MSENGVFIRKVGKYFLLAANDGVNVSDKSIVIAEEGNLVETLNKLAEEDSNDDEEDNPFGGSPDPPGANMITLKTVPAGKVAQVIAVVREYSAVSIEGAKQLVDQVKNHNSPKMFAVSSAIVPVGGSISASAEACVKKLQDLGCSATWQ